MELWSLTPDEIKVNPAKSEKVCLVIGSRIFGATQEIERRKIFEALPNALYGTFSESGIRGNLHTGAFGYKYHTIRPELVRWGLEQNKAKWFKEIEFKEGDDLDTAFEFTATVNGKYINQRTCKIDQKGRVSKSSFEFSDKTSQIKSLTESFRYDDSGRIIRRDREGVYHHNQTYGSIDICTYSNNGTGIAEIVHEEYPYGLSNGELGFVSRSLFDTHTNSTIETNIIVPGKFSLLAPEI